MRFKSSRLLAAAASLLVISCTGKKQSTQEVNLAIWGNYLSKEVQEQFTKQTGLKLNVTNYSSNEELLAKVQSGGAGIDVAVPSDYMVNIMVKLGLLEPLQADLIPSRQGLEAQWLKQSYDPENKFSLPYAWGTAGIAYHKELLPNPPRTWKDIFTRKDLAGKISLMDDVRETTAAALKMHGYGVNTTNPKELAAAKKTLLEVKPRVKRFGSDTIELLLNKEVALAHAYSPESLQAVQRSNGKVEFFIPEEGGTIAIDNAVIIKGSKNIVNAHKLINFLLSPEVNLAFVQNVMGGPVVKGTFEKLPEGVKKNKALFPDAAFLKKLERIEDLGDNTKLYDDLWTEVKTE